MPNPNGAGFFGKLPGTGDFVQRKLPASFVDVWDHHFEQAVAASRAQLGDVWAQLWRDGAVWRFVLAPGVCGNDAWAGVTGPASDRVGRCFPMVIAAPLPDAGVINSVLDNDGWFAAAESAHRQAQATGEGADAFAEHIEALPDLLAAAPAAREAVPLVDWASASHWRLPLPATTDTAFLTALWTSLRDPAGAALWWTHGAPRMPASVLVTRGLPDPQAHAGMLDAALGGSVWRALGTFATPSAPILSPAAAASPAPAPAPAPAQPAPVPVRLPDDLSELFADLAPHLDAIEPDVPKPAQHAPDVGGARALHRYDCALTVVVADDGAPNPHRQAAAAVSELIDCFVPSDFVAGMQALRTRLLVLHSRLRQLAESEGEPAREDGAVIALHVTGRWANLLRIGTASAWQWRAGQMHPLFAGGGEPAPDGAGLGGELDDLLFSRTATVAPGLGAAAQPLCDEIVCEVNAGDRLLLLTTRRLVDLPLPLLTAALALPLPDAAAAHIAAAAGLGAITGSWPLAVIEVQP